jgi:hypothetical protein
MYLHITKQENNQRYKKCKIKELKDSILINKENEKIKKKQKKTVKRFFVLIALKATLPTSNARSETSASRSTRM